MGGKPLPEMTADPKYRFIYWPDHMEGVVQTPEGEFQVSASREATDGMVDLRWDNGVDGQAMSMTLDSALAMLRCLRHLADCEARRQFDANPLCPACGKRKADMALRSCPVGGCPLGNDL
jgi:hypothetical protein